MVEGAFQGIELLPDATPTRQLFVLLHGLGASAAALLPLAGKLRTVFPDAAYVIPDAPSQCTDGGAGRQWFSINGMTDENRSARVAAALPALSALLQQAQERCHVSPAATALVGFSQGAIMALETSALHDGMVGRVLGFSGRFARLPEQAPAATTLHLMHGEADKVIPVSHAHAAYKRLQELQGDATLDIASAVGHELHDELIERAINRLQTCIPLRTWKQALDDA